MSKLRFRQNHKKTTAVAIVTLVAKNVENVALGLVVVFILVFLIVIYNAIRDSKKK